jgi:hypothetical protein
MILRLKGITHMVYFVIHIAGSNPAQSVDVCPRFLCCVVLCR